MLFRSVVRAVQQARKDAGFDVSDRIALTLGHADDDAVRSALEAHRDLIAGETLATSVTLQSTADGSPVAVGEGQTVSVGVVRA